MSDLMREINNMSWKPEKLADEVTSEHRTLQQQAGAGFLLCFEQWADDYREGWYDARNEAICRKASIIMKALTEAGESVSVPFI